VVNFQSWLDPFIIITALPGALTGVVWALFISQTTLSVPALMGAIMSLGVATANSVLVVSFASENLRRGLDPIAAALDAGASRIRPVLMTALAMVIGLLPMSLGLGEGGEQNAPLGRAVIGGLVLATVATLFFVPFVVGFLPRWRARQALAAETRELAVPTVTVVSPVQGKPVVGVSLPAEVRPYVEAPIYARASGFVKRWLVDIGDRVESGQLLAEID